MRQRASGFVLSQRHPITRKVAPADAKSASAEGPDKTARNGDLGFVGRSFTSEMMNPTTWECRVPYTFAVFECAGDNAEFSLAREKFEI